MEPVIHALVTLVAHRSISARPTWRYRLVSARGGACPITHVWTPSVHTILRAGGTIEDPRSLARADTAWINDLASLYERVALDIPGLVAPAPRLVEERR